MKSFPLIHTLTFLVMFTLGTLACAEESTIQRFLLVSASNEGGPDRATLRYAASDARSVSKVLEEMGGIPRQNRVVVNEPDPVALRQGLDLMDALLRKAPALARKEVIVYYSGHADDEGLLLGNARMSWKELRSRVEGLPADVRITILDACGSGAIVRAKGGERRPAFLMDESSNMKGTAFLTSSTASEVSQESDRLKASFFTHALVSGLRGAADLNNDKKVTLSEAYQFAFQETLNRTEETTGGTQHPSRDMNLSGSGDVVLTDLRGMSTGITLNKDLQGRFYIRDSQGQLIAELHKSPGHEIEIGLSPGNYQVRMEVDNVSEVQVALAPGGHEVLSPSRFKLISTEKTRSRGRCTQCDENPWHEELVGKPNVNDLQFAMTKSDTAFRGMQLSTFLNQANQGILGKQIAVIGANLSPRGFDGMQLAGSFNYAGEKSTGLQFAGGLNIADDLSGLQISYINYANSVSGVQSGFANISKGNVSGVQGGFANIGIDTLHGVQGGFANINLGPSNGVQGGFSNISGWGGNGLQGGFINVAGTQTMQAGFINVADSLGMQIGFINIANECKLPIGFISFSRRGLYGVRGTIDETHWKQSTFFSGSPLFYTEFVYGQNEWGHSTQQSLGYGIGTHFGMQGPFWLQLEAASHVLNMRTADTSNRRWRCVQRTFRIMAG